MDIEYFWSKVNKTSTCWLWTSRLDKDGYGRYGNCRSGTERAHRISYILCKGVIPDGMHIDHLCRVRNCVNPDHLDAVTAYENLRRSPFFNGNKTHCIRGHEFNEINTIFVNRRRKCRLCTKEWECNNPKIIEQRRRINNAWHAKQDRLHEIFSKQITKRALSHCNRGHEFTKENSRYVYRKKRSVTFLVRQCRACDRDKSRKHRNIDPSKFRPYRITELGRQETNLAPTDNL